MLRLVYTRHHSLASVLIRLVTWSPWSHVAIATEDGTVIESRALSGGVVERPISQALSGASRIEWVSVPCPDPEAAIAWARTQLGQRYDWSAAIGIGLHRRWDRTGRWYCSELVEAALAQAGRPRFRSAAVSRVTPQMSYMVL